MNKITVVIGASDNPERYSYKAVLRLQWNQHTVVPVGITATSQACGTPLSQVAAFVKFPLDIAVVISALE